MQARDAYYTITHTWFQCLRHPQHQVSVFSFFGSRSNSLPYLSVPLRSQLGKARTVFSPSFRWWGESGLGQLSTAHGSPDHRCTYNSEQVQEKTCQFALNFDFFCWVAQLVSFFKIFLENVIEIIRVKFLPLCCHAWHADAWLTLFNITLCFSKSHQSYQCPEAPCRSHQCPHRFPW